MDIMSCCLGLQNEDHEEGFATSEPLSSSKTSRYHDQYDTKTSDFTVLVTGMGAYPKAPGDLNSGHYTESDNTSHLITTLLPSQLPPFSTHNPTALTINILNPTSATGCAVRSEYSFVRRYCQKLWAEHGNEVDLILHLGMADGWEWYAIERSAWKQGTVKGVDNGRGRNGDPVEYYALPDDVNQTVRDAGACPWGKEVPEQLCASPGFDIDDVARNVQLALNEKLGKSEGDEIEVRAHPDGGNYLCGFISYESAAQRLVGGYKAKTLFCHIPNWKDKERLEIGRDFVCRLVAYIATLQ